MTNSNKLTQELDVASIELLERFITSPDERFSIHQKIAGGVGVLLGILAAKMSVDQKKQALQYIKDYVKEMKEESHV